MNSFYGDNLLHNVGGERVKVALRVRPMMQHEISKGDEAIVGVPDSQHCLLQLKTGAKNFRFNAVLDEKAKQSDVFNGCGVHVRILGSLALVGTNRFCARRLFSHNFRLRLDRFR